MRAEPTDLLSTGRAAPDDALDAFTAWVARGGLTLYPAQDEALLELAAGSHVILSTPTGSGKSLVATGAARFACARGVRTFYTAPIKALVSEKFFALCDQFGAESVGMMTGDATVNRDAPIICATAEVLANLALRAGPEADVGLVVMDEFHYYGDPDRGWAWQVPLIELTGTQFLLMSATLGDVSFFVDDLTRRTGRDTAAVTGTVRPVPLDFAYATTPVHETIEQLVAAQRAPVYVVHFSQAAAVERAQALLSTPLIDRTGRAAVAAALGDFRFASGFGATLSKLVRAGIGVHHAGMLPRYRRLVERLAQDGLLRVIAGTDTLGVGINVPIRTVLFTALTKFDGVRVRHLQAREFHQIAGRAGRAGFDDRGYVVAQAPEHDVENARAIAKAGDDPKKLKKIQRKKPPEGFVSWGEPTFAKLTEAPPEPLRSHFRVSTAMVLDVIARPGDCFIAMRRLLEENHEPRRRQLHHIRTAIAIYRGLLASGLVEPGSEGIGARVTADLPANFALSNPLSPFAIATLELLDTTDPNYALDALSVMESTVEDPRPVLRAQRDAARAAAVEQMKADGLEYTERMERLEEIGWPAPLTDLIEHAFSVYAVGHPWASASPPSPKSVVREMVEHADGFGDVVARYRLARSEGVLLRYLTDTYRILRQSIPPAFHTDELDDVVEWLGDMVRRVDSSLVDEWEHLAHPTDPAPTTPHDGAPTVKVPLHPRALRVHVRNHMFALVTAIARHDWAALHTTHPEVPWESAFDDYFDEYDQLGIDAAARSPDLFTMATDDDGDWRVRQIIDDPEGDHGWSLTARVPSSTPNASTEEMPPIVDVTIVAG